MKDLLGLKDGDTIDALVCFTDIARFTQTAQNLSIQQIAQLLLPGLEVLLPDQDSQNLDNTAGQLLGLRRRQADALGASQDGLGPRQGRHGQGDALKGGCLALLVLFSAL